MAFQITDDILDYTAKGREFGKSIGKDLEEGKLTLPFIFALKQSTEEEKSRMKEIIASKKNSGKAAREVRKFIEKYEGLDLSRYTASGYIKAAKQQLDVFADCAEKNHLITVADYILSRNV
jgi:octaprenyl-diphosphate synthase